MQETINKTTFQERLKMLRTHLGMTQKQMAVKIGISSISWQKYELGETMPGGMIFIKLAELGFDINWLLVDSGEMILYTEPVYRQDVYDRIVELANSKIQNDKISIENDDYVTKLQLIYWQLTHSKFNAITEARIDKLINFYIGSCK